MKNLIFYFSAFFLPLTLISQSTLPNIPIADSLGNELLLLDVLDEDKNYIIEVYANWCGWCKAELIKWKDCYEDWETDYNVEVFVLSTDGFDNPEPAMSFFASKELDYKLYFTNQDTVLNSLGVNSFPTNFLVNFNGEIVDTIVGYGECEDISSKIEENFESVATSIQNSKHTSQINIVGTRNGIIVDNNDKKEPIFINLYSTDGRLLKRIEGKQTDVHIKLDLNTHEIVIVNVINKNWIKSELILTR